MTRVCSTGVADPEKRVHSGAAAVFRGISCRTTVTKAVTASTATAPSSPRLLELPWAEYSPMLSAGLLLIGGGRGPGVRMVLARQVCES